MKVILKKMPLYESFDFDSDFDDENYFDSIIESNRYKKFLEENYEIEEQIKPYKKDGNIFVDVDGDVIVKNKKLTSLTEGRFCFGKVQGNFNCSSCKSLKSLEGGPKEVGEYFNCENCNSLISLEGAPKEVGSFYCNNCKSLKSLKGAPSKVDWDFFCWDCESLTSIKGSPEKVGRDFFISGCTSLTSLEGSPKEVGRDFNCCACQYLKSLEGAPEIVGGNFYYEECCSLKSRVLPATTKIKGEIFD